MLRVFLCFTGEELPAAPEDRLSSYRKEQLAHLRNPTLRRQSLCAELLLVYALRESGFEPTLPLTIATGEHGKPYLTDGTCRFSLSHSGEALFCALCDAEIGADVEQRREANEALMRRFFRSDERDRVLRAPDRDDAFTEIWTMKESYCKFSGEGLGLALDSFSVLDGSIAPGFRHWKVGEFHLALYAEGPLPEKSELHIVDKAALKL